MEYLKVRWFHGHAHEPIELYIELDDERRETRKVEVFRDGRMGFADADRSTASTVLGEKQVPVVSELNRDPQFAAELSNAAEFDRVWAEASQR